LPRRWATQRTEGCSTAEAGARRGYGRSTSPHLHRDDETLYIVDGALDFRETETGATYHLTAGDKLVLPARLPHSASSREGATYIMGIRTLVPFDEHLLPIE
jgi:cupin superfamily acireductone dioxygenase involved in methionine salvage